MARKKANQFNTDEIYRQLRSNIEFSQMDEDIQVMNVVSTFLDEGKTTVSQNLAKIMAAKYRNVLLIDCDLRNPSVHKRLHISNKRGLTNLMAEFDPNQALNTDCIQSVQFKETQSLLHVITAGHRVPNPAEVLGSRRFGMLIDALRKAFGYIIIDCPPLGATADAIPVSNIADGTLFVISSKDTDKRKAKAAIQDLQRNGANVFGIVLTKVENVGKKKYGYGYGYGYGQDEDNA